MSVEFLKRLVFLTVLLLPASLALSQAPTVREVMEAIVAPATDVLWGVEEPMSDADWLEVDSAMIAVIAAGLLVKTSDSVADLDETRAAAAKWQGYNDEMIGAAVAARQAIVARDFAALTKAGEDIYPPCEKCHLTYHPELQ